MSIINTLKILISPLPDAEKTTVKPKTVARKPLTPTAPVQCDKKTLPPEQPKPTPPKHTQPTQTLTPYELGLLWGRVHGGYYKNCYEGNKEHGLTGNPSIDKERTTIEQHEIEGIVVGETATYYRKQPEEYPSEEELHSDGEHAYLWHHVYQDRITVTWRVRNESLPQPIRDKVFKRISEAFENAKRLKQQTYEKWEADAKRPLTEEEKELIERDRKEMILFTRVIIAAIIAVAICIAIAFFAA